MEYKDLKILPNLHDSDFDTFKPWETNNPSRGDQGTVHHKPFISRHVYITHPLRATGIFSSTNNNTIGLVDGFSKLILGPNLN